MAGHVARIVDGFWGGGVGIAQNMKHKNFCLLSPFRTARLRSSSSADVQFRLVRAISLCLANQGCAKTSPMSPGVKCPKGSVWPWWGVCPVCGCVESRGYL